MNNLPPDWIPERFHDERCAALCPLANEPCEDHDDHDCTCAELHERDIEAQVEAILETFGTAGWVFS